MISKPSFNKKKLCLDILYAIEEKIINLEKLCKKIKKYIFIIVNIRFIHLKTYIRFIHTN
jgi:hypothetical protein